VDRQREEVISEAEAQRLIAQGKENYINYHAYVGLNDKISIDHYHENSQQELVKPVSGANNLVAGGDHKNSSGGVITHSEAKETHQLDNKLLLKIFQEHDIKEVSLTTEGDLLIKYNSGKSKTLTKNANDHELQKISNFCQKTGQLSLSRQDLNTLANHNSVSPQPNSWLTPTLLIGGSVVVAISIV
jgi:hypothetical protein